MIIRVQNRGLRKIVHFTLQGREFREKSGAGLAAVPGSPDLDSYRAALAAGLGLTVQDGYGLGSGSRMEEGTKKQAKGELVLSLKECPQEVAAGHFLSR